MKSFACAIMAASVCAWDNSTPIYGTYPGWQTGTNTSGIEIEIIVDLLCEDSAALNPILEQLFNKTWNDSTYGE